MSIQIDNNFQGTDESEKIGELLVYRMAFSFFFFFFLRNPCPPIVHLHRLHDSPERVLNMRTSEFFHIFLLFSSPSLIQS